MGRGSMFCADDEVIFNLNSGKNCLLNVLTWTNLEDIVQSPRQKDILFECLYIRQKSSQILGRRKLNGAYHSW